MREEREEKTNAKQYTAEGEPIDHLSILLAFPFPDTLAGLPEGFGSSLFTRDRRPEPK